MHADEVVTDASLVRRLLEPQFLQWAGLPIDAGFTVLVREAAQWMTVVLD